MFKVNPAAFAGVFVLPSEIADKHLLLASAPQLKVILWLYKNASAPAGAEEIAAGTGLSTAEAEDAAAYWRDCGLLLDDSAAVFPANTAKPEAKATEENKPLTQVISVKPSKPTYAQICERINESAEVRELFSEAQLRLGRTIGSGDQATLLLLFDYYGLPVEIILTICEYARTHKGRNNMNYIYTVGADWSRREIDTIERADAELRRLESLSASWSEFCSSAGVSLGTPTAPQQKYLDMWLNDWHFPMNMIVLAYEEMSKHVSGTVSFSYMNKILGAWHKDGVSTPEDIKEREYKFTENREKKALEHSKSPYNTGKRKYEESSEPASYDIETAEREAMISVPVLRKREKR